MALLSLNPRLARALLPTLVAFLLVFLVFFTYSHSQDTANFLKSIPAVKYGDWTGDHRPPTTNPPPKHKPAPAWQPPPIVDPFPLLATTNDKPPPIPKHNVPRPDLHKDYNITSPPPLFIGFTRQWPMLLQAVVSYITAGWPAEHIYVVENTGVHNYNKLGKLTLQNPFYLNHTSLERLGVQVIQTPVLLSFAQLQNFFLSIAYERNHDYYFYSHQDVVVFSLEDGRDDIHRPSDRDWDFYDDKDKEAAMNPPAANQPGYRTVYENCMRDLRYVIDKKERWGFRWYQYDHLTLVNRAAMDAVGGWDSLIPYYGSDCDMNGKLGLDGWTMKHRRVGLFNDVSTVMADLGVFYRDPRAGRPKFVDPNPQPPEEEQKIAQAQAEKAAKEKADKAAAAEKVKDPNKPTEKRDDKSFAGHDQEEPMPFDPIAYFRILNQVGVDMGNYKYRDSDLLRNNWQKSQRGGQGEPFHYDWEGFAIAFRHLTDAGMRTYEEKWGHRGCDIVTGTGLRIEDQWRVEHDWEEKKDKKEGKGKVR